MGLLESYVGGGNCSTMLAWHDHAVEMLLLFRFHELEEALSMADAHQQEAEKIARQLVELKNQLSALQEQVMPLL